MSDTALQIVEMSPEPVRGRGRPATITLPVVEEVARLIAKGMTEEQACLRLGVVHASLRTARHRNPEFETAIKEAQAAFLDESLDIIGNGERGWQGRAWILERRHGEQFRRNTGLEINALVGNFTPADLLAAKPIQHWSSAELNVSVGAWVLLRQWRREQVEQLLRRYQLEWGIPDNWTDGQLEWAVEVERRLEELRREEAGDGCGLQGIPQVTG